MQYNILIIVFKPFSKIINLFFKVDTSPNLKGHLSSLRVFLQSYNHRSVANLIVSQRMCLRVWCLYLLHIDILGFDTPWRLIPHPMT